MDISAIRRVDYRISYKWKTNWLKKYRQTKPLSRLEEEIQVFSREITSGSGRYIPSEVQKIFSNNNWKRRY